jgi:hypothetical protein
MKKLLVFCSIFALVGSTTLAAELTLNPVPATTEKLIQFADQAIAQEKISVDKLLNVLQTIHETQKADLESALAQGKLTAAQQTLTQWSEMYPLTTHLYDVKAGSGYTLTTKEGLSYTLKQISPLSWLNVSRGEDTYYSFPHQELFVELQAQTHQSGTLYNDITLRNTDQQYFPSYVYGGGNALYNLATTDTGRKIMDVKDQETDIYSFFDAPADMLTKDFSFVQSSGSHIAGKDLYKAVSYSPAYFLTSLDKGFQFCQKVSDFVGATSGDKEYPTEQCLDAANGKFYKEMHKDILTYALDSLR